MMGSLIRRVGGYSVSYHDDGGAVKIGDHYIATIDEDALGLFTGAVSWEESSKRLGVVMDLVAGAYLAGQEDAAVGRVV